jgi:transposase InsO family protein
MRLALKAQSQCRATVEALAEMKNPKPVAYVQQANIANGPQQVNNNGVPFASRGAFFGLSKLSVWWLRLGIGIERIMPAHPQQNGRHERMHLTLKKEATKLQERTSCSSKPRSISSSASTTRDPRSAIGAKPRAACGRP